MINANNELELYQRSRNNIWTDNYIAGNLLEAHLDTSSDAASRNINTIYKTIGWIEKQIPKNASILDLGCGPGLYSSILASHGYAVTGIDVSECSIMYARKNAHDNGLSINYHILNYIEDEIVGSYDVVMMIYCDFGALTKQEQETVLKKIKTSLKPNGVLIFDVFGKDLVNTKKDKRTWCFSNGNDFWNKKKYYLLEEIKTFREHNTIGTRYIIIDNINTREYIFWDHYYNETEIKQVLLNNGFKVEIIERNLVESNDFTSNEVLFTVSKLL